MDRLQAFYNDNHMKETVYLFLMEYLKKHALQKVFEGKDTSAIKEAKHIIEGAFADIDILYSPKPKPTSVTSR